MTKLEQVQMAIASFNAKYHEVAFHVLVSRDDWLKLKDEVGRSAIWSSTGGSPCLTIGDATVCISVFKSPGDGITVTNYRRHTYTVYEEKEAPTSPPICECGSSKVGSTNHSSWCPIRS